MATDRQFICIIYIDADGRVLTLFCMYWLHTATSLMLPLHGPTHWTSLNALIVWCRYSVCFPVVSNLFVKTDWRIATIQNNYRFNPARMSIKQIPGEFNSHWPQRFPVVHESQPIVPIKLSIKLHWVGTVWTGLKICWSRAVELPLQFACAAVQSRAASANLYTVKPRFVDAVAA